MAKKIRGTNAKAWFYGQSFHSSNAAADPLPTHQHICRHCGNVFACDRPHFTVVMDGPQRGKQLPCPPPEFVNTCARPDCAFRGF